MTQLTIQLPDDMARNLENVAAALQKSVEQVAVERLQAQFHPAGSPVAVLSAMHQPPHVSPAEVDEMEAAIAGARIPRRIASSRARS